MKTILFLDDWMLERATGLERIWYKPTFVKQLITDFHPESLGYGGYYSVFYDDRLVALGGSQGIVPMCDMDELEEKMSEKQDPEAYEYDISQVNIIDSNWRHQTYENSRAIRFVEKDYENDSIAKREKYVDRLFRTIIEYEMMINNESKKFRDYGSIIRKSRWELIQDSNGLQLASQK